MTVGGTVLFKNSNIKRIDEILLEIFQHNETWIELFTIKLEEIVKKIDITTYCLVGIFKVTIPQQLVNAYFMNLSDSNIKAPTVLLLKFLGDVNNIELQNEIDIHTIFGAQSNIMPFCPSFLFHEQIKTKSTPMTRLGTSFYQLLKNRHKQSNFFNEYQLQNGLLELTPIGTDIYNQMESYFKVQDIIIMELLECSTLFEFTERATIPPYIHTVYNKRIRFNNYTEIKTFYVFFLATLMALANYSHGDLHSGNVFICSNTTTNPPTIIPYVIDFGRSVSIDNLELEELKPDALVNFNTRYAGYGITYTKIKKIYQDAVTNKNIIVEYIKNKIKANRYIDAVIIMSMCRNKYNRKIDSMFYYTFDPEINYQGYSHIYNINDYHFRIYNYFIKNLIKKRQTVQTQLHKFITNPPQLNKISLKNPITAPRATPRTAPRATPRTTARATPRTAARASPITTARANRTATRANRTATRATRATPRTAARATRTATRTATPRTAPKVIS